MTQKIKDDFFKSDSTPFESSDYYIFFGYNRHSNFKRFLDKEKFYPHIFCDSFSKITTRERNTISFDRELFLSLCETSNIVRNEIEEIAIEYYSSVFKAKIKKFIVITKENRISNLKIYNIPCGKYYNYSLNTYNIANDLLLCPYDLFKFCNKECPYFEYSRVGLTDEFDYYKTKIPAFYFDNIHYTKRHEFLLLLKYILENYKMSDMSKKLGKIYYQDIKDMLNEQIKIDHIKNEKAKNKNTHKIKAEFKPSQAEKDMYRKACKLYHPDKNPNGEEIFKIINKAYKEGNVSILKKYSSL